MGRSMSTMRPENREETQDELDEVLESSRSVLNWTDRTITNERYIMLNNDVIVIKNKVENWLIEKRPMLELAMEGLEIIIKDIYRAEFQVIIRETENRLRSKYSTAYRELRKFMRSVKKIARVQRKIHEHLLELKDLPPDNMISRIEELAELSEEVFGNVCKIEKKETKYKRLHEKFDYEVLQIDANVEVECKKRVEDLKNDILMNNLPH